MFQIIALVVGFLLFVSGIFMYAGLGPAFIAAGALIIVFVCLLVAIN